MIEFFKTAREKRMAQKESVGNLPDVTGSVMAPSVTLKNGHLFIRGGEKNPFSFKIIDIVGKVVSQGICTSLVQQYDLSSLPKGLYVLMTDIGYNYRFLK